MPYPKNEKKFTRWTLGVDESFKKDPASWNIYDFVIRDVLAVYARHLSLTPGFVPIDWQKIKAMLWTETGALDPAWLTAPMQCGVHGDKGLVDLLTLPAGKLMIPPEYANKFTATNVPHNAALNIQAGTGVLLLRMANHGMVPDRPSTVFGVAAGQMQMARSAASMVAAVQRESGPRSLLVHKSIHTPQAKGSYHYAVTGWRPFDFDTIYLRYNGGGDGNYPDKLQHCYDIITGRVRL